MAETESEKTTREGSMMVAVAYVGLLALVTGIGAILHLRGKGRGR